MFACATKLLQNLTKSGLEFRLVISSDLVFNFVVALKYISP